MVVCPVVPVRICCAFIHLVASAYRAFPAFKTCLAAVALTDCINIRKTPVMAFCLHMSWIVCAHLLMGVLVIRQPVFRPFMSKGLCHSCNTVQFLSADRTVHHFIIAAVFFACCSCLVFNHSLSRIVLMSDFRYCFCPGLSADCAGIGFFTFLCFCRFLSNCSCVPCMTRCRYRLCFTAKLFVTARAVNYFVIAAVFCACRCNYILTYRRE